MSNYENIGFLPGDIEDKICFLPQDILNEIMKDIREAAELTYTNEIWSKIAIFPQESEIHDWVKQGF